VRRRQLLFGALAAVFLLAACSTTSSTWSTSAAVASGTPSTSGSATDIMKLEPLEPIKPGAYFIDPDGNRSTSMHVAYEVAAEGWSQWIGAAKLSDVGHVGLSITTVTSLVTDGCHDHSWAKPPIGPAVGDLAAALATLAPFRVTSPPSDVSAHGYSGKHLEWMVPELPVDPADPSRFTGCVNGSLASWVAFVDVVPGDAYYGYSGPGYREEFWILDVDGTRLMIAAGTSPGSSPTDIAERDAILASIRIQP
jgi:hypothetical protein